MTYYSIRDTHGSIVCGGTKELCETHREIEEYSNNWSIDYERRGLADILQQPWLTHYQRGWWIRFHRERMAEAKARLKYWQAATIEVRA